MQERLSSKFETPQTCFYGPTIIPMSLDNVAIAWAGTNQQLNVTITGSSLGELGTVFTEADQATSDAPTIVYVPEGTTPARLLMAWKGSGNDDVSFATLALSADQTSVTSFTKLPLSLLSFTRAAPVLAIVGNELMMSFTSSSDNTIKYVDLGDVGENRDPVLGAIQTVPDATSYFAPALCFTRGRGFFIAWTAGDSTLQVFNPNEGFAYNPGPATTRISFPNQTSPQGPSLAYIYDRLYLGWTGSSNRQINIYREDLWYTDSNSDVSTLSDTSDSRIGLCGALTAADQAILDMSWAGIGNNSINVYAGVTPATLIGALESYKKRDINSEDRKSEG